MTGCRYGLSAPEEASESGPASAVDEEADGDNATAGAGRRRHLSAKERKLMKKQVSAELRNLNFGLSASKIKPSSRSRWVDFISRCCVNFKSSSAHECQGQLGVLICVSATLLKGRMLWTPPDLNLLQCMMCSARDRHTL